MKKEDIISILEGIMDPEIPVLSITDLGILRTVDISDGDVLITITPTYSGCPAMDTIQQDIRSSLAEKGIDRVKINQVLSPAWTSDWMSKAGKAKLEAYGIAPPSLAGNCDLSEAGNDGPNHCPNCLSKNTELISRFGSTACKALYRCRDCGEPFDYFKCH